jgi:hypothetical protein
MSWFQILLSNSSNLCRYGLDDLADALENLDLEQLKKLIGKNGAGGMVGLCTS